MKNLIIASFALLALTGCASIISGTSQQISVNSTPTGADCKVQRQGITIGRVTTPGTVSVDRTKHDITLECSKPGYQTTTYISASESEGATLGNIVLGGFIGWGIDSATGADNSYDNTIHVHMHKE